VGLLLCHASLLCAADWAHWRGPARNSTTPEDSAWDAGGWRNPKPVWTTRVGEGGSSPIVVGDRLYVLGWKDDQDTLLCLDATTGKEVWKRSYPARPYARYATGDEGWYKGVSSTPEYDPQTGWLYTLSLDGDLRAWDARTGEPDWHGNLYDQYRVPRRPGNRDYGYTSSPLVLGDWLLVEVGSREGNVVALDKRTGRRLWASECRDPAGHNGGPTPMTVDGVPCLAAFTLHHLVVMRLDRGHEGKTIAEHPWETEFNNNIASPTTWENKVIVTSGYNQNRFGLFDVTLKGIAKTRELKGHHSGVCSPVVYRDHVYVAFERVACYEVQPEGLRSRWDSRPKFRFGPGGSCVVTGEGRLIIFAKTNPGRFRLVLADTLERSPDAYRELAAFEDVLPTSSGPEHQPWPHVVLAGGRVVCKDRRGQLACFRVAPGGGKD
jgi:outer membrane protein assembly factor BamB